MGLNSVRGLGVVAAVLAVSLALPHPALGAKKKKDNADAAKAAAPAKPDFDPKTLAWPSPPRQPRIHWLDYYAGMKIDHSQDGSKKEKTSWMDRLAGGQSAADKTASMKKIPFQLMSPYGIAEDSKGQVYVADNKVGAIFIFDPETHETQLIRNGYEAHFSLLNCLAIDDDDRLFVSDGQLRQVIVFSPKHEVETYITDGILDPVGLALDTTNRFLYVVDTKLDQVLVYDADSYKLLRKIGTTGKNHFLTDPGDFAAPSGVAVDGEGNVYVTDTLNDRVEIFDADGGFISTFGKNGDSPGAFARPKGIAIDGDGHIWVADQANDRLQVFNKDGQLLTFIGVNHGKLPGQFSSLINVAIDKKNRVFTAEQFPGRVQVFQYVSDQQAVENQAKWEADQQKAAEERRKRAATRQASPAAPAAAGDAAPKP